MVTRLFSFCLKMFLKSVLGGIWRFE